MSKPNRRTAGSDASYSTEMPGDSPEGFGERETEVVDEGIALAARAVVVTDFGMAISYNLRRAVCFSDAPLFPVEVHVSDGIVSGVRHIATFHNTSTGVISVETERVGGIMLTVKAIVERSGSDNKKVIRGEWRLPIH